MSPFFIAAILCGVALIAFALFAVLWRKKRARHKTPEHDALFMLVYSMRVSQSVDELYTLAMRLEKFLTENQNTLSLMDVYETSLAVYKPSVFGKRDVPPDNLARTRWLLKIAKIVSLSSKLPAERRLNVVSFVRDVLESNRTLTEKLLQNTNGMFSEKLIKSLASGLSPNPCEMTKLDAFIMHTISAVAWDITCRPSCDEDTAPCDYLLDAGLMFDSKEEKIPRDVSTAAAYRNLLSLVGNDNVYGAFSKCIVKWEQLLGTDGNGSSEVFEAALALAANYFRINLRYEDEGIVKALVDILQSSATDVVLPVLKVIKYMTFDNKANAKYFLDCNGPEALIARAKESDSAFPLLSAVVYICDNLLSALGSPAKEALNKQQLKEFINEHFYTEDLVRRPPLKEYEQNSLFVTTLARVSRCLTQEM